MLLTLTLPMPCYFRDAFSVLHFPNIQPGTTQRRSCSRLHVHHVGDLLPASIVSPHPAHQGCTLIQPAPHDCSLRSAFFGDRLKFLQSLRVVDGSTRAILFH